MITIVDYGLGNIGSITNMISKLGFTSQITADEEVIRAAQKIILPGVGHFARGMENLEKLNLIPVLKQKVLIEKTPVLGICLGMQLMGDFSEEGNCNGLGWIKSRFVKFDTTHTSLKIPCIGWNHVFPQKESVLFKDIIDPRFYFVHSFHATDVDPSDVLAEAEYGYKYVTAYSRDNIFGVQFHPEKSHSFGLRLLKNFIELT